MDDIVQPSDVAETTTNDSRALEGQIETSPGEQPPLEESSSAGNNWLLEGLKNTEPNPRLDEVDSLNDIRRYWKEYGMRGLQKWAGVDEAAAWVDLLKFAVGATIEISDKRQSSTDTNDSGSGAERTDSGIELAPRGEQ